MKTYLAKCYVNKCAVINYIDKDVIL